MLYDQCGLAINRMPNGDLVALDLAADELELIDQIETLLPRPMAWLASNGLPSKPRIRFGIGRWSKCTIARRDSAINHQEKPPILI